jgi:hypothetical protein
MRRPAERSAAGYAGGIGGVRRIARAWGYTMDAEDEVFVIEPYVSVGEVLHVLLDHARHDIDPSGSPTTSM